MKLGARDVAALQCPGIAHLWGDHYLIVRGGVTADTLTVTNPPNMPTSLPISDFQKAYSGFVLLVAKDASVFPVPKAEGSDLRFDKYSWDCGSVYEGDNVEHSFTCRNVGNADLVISKIGTSCGECVVPISGPQTIPPGGEGEIRVLVATANQKRGVSKTVYVASNDPISPVVQLGVSAYVSASGLPVFPRSVKYGSRRRIECAMRQVLIPSPEQSKVEVTSVSSDSPHITAVLSQSTDRNEPGWIVSIGLRPGAPIGELKAKVTVLSNHARQPKAEIPVTATVRGNVDLDRDTFFLGIAKKGEERRAPLTISTVSKSPLKIGKVESSLACVSVNVAPKTEGKEYVLTATLKPDAPLGNIKGEVTIHTNDPDQPEIKVAVYAYVEEEQPG